MRSRSFVPDENTKIAIIQGLLKLKKAGELVGVDATEHILRVQYAPGGLWKLIGWRKGWDMVAQAREAAARASQATEPAPRTAPKSKGSQRVVARTVARRAPDRSGG